MSTRHWVGAGVLLMLAVTKAHMLFMRLVILAAAGLAGLFLLHVLAQDYRKIQANRPKAFGLFKRSVDSGEYLIGADMESKFSAAQKHYEQMKKAELLETNDLSLLGAASYLDPQGCARRYLCTIAAKPVDTTTGIEQAMLELIERSSKDAVAFREAVRLGRKDGNATLCTARYPRCTFSVTEMLRLIQPVY